MFNQGRIDNRRKSKCCFWTSAKIWFKDSSTNRKDDENIADTEGKVAVAEEVRDKDVVENSTKDAMEIIEVSVPESVTYAHVDVRL